MTVASDLYGIEDLFDLAPAIESATVRKVTFRKTDPTWRFALAAKPVSSGAVLLLQAADGLRGYGSACEIGHIGYEFGEIEASLARVLPVLETARSRSARQRIGNEDGLRRLRGPARAIVHTALLDLVARSKGVAAYGLLGEPERTELAVTRILSLKTPAEMAEIAGSLVRQGYRYLKIKLDNDDADLDVARVAAIRGAVGPDVGLTVDANQSYSPEGAIAVAERLVAYGVALFEQPSPAGDLAGLREIRERSPLPIEADESAVSVDDVRLLVEAGAVDGVSLKVAKLGGVDRMLAAAELCAAAGVYVRVGAHVGSRILNAVALHGACVLPELKDPSELAEFERLRGDPATGMSAENGRVQVSESTGLGTVVPQDFEGEE